MNKIKKAPGSFSFKKLIYKPEFSILVLLVIMVVTAAFLQKNFFKMESINRNVDAFTPLILLAMGQTVVIISGGIDLSVGTSVSFITCLLTFIMRTNSPVTGFYALLIAFAAAIFIGLINGIGVGILRIPPVILTFATSFIWLGFALFLRPSPGGQTVNWFQIFYNVSEVNWAPEWFKTLAFIFPPGLILVILGGVVWFIISKTQTGRHIYAVGSNFESAYMCGVNTAKTQIIAYMINSVFIFLTAIFFVGQTLSGDARLGDSLPLKVVAAAVIGGVALSGGQGSIAFAVIGALILSLVSKIIFFANIPSAYQTFVSGIIVIIAILGSLAYKFYGREASILAEKRIE